MIRLNLGCGSNLLVGYHNIDLYVVRPGVINADVAALPYGDGTAAEIIADDVLEHFPRLQWPAVFAEWVRVLAPSGTMTIRFPEMTHLAAALVKANTPESWEAINRRIFGGQGDGVGDGRGMFHFTGFSSAYLRNHAETVHGLEFVGESFANFNCTLTMRKP